MSNDRPTVTFSTSTGRKVTIKSYFTAREQIAINQIMFSRMRFNKESADDSDKSGSKDAGNSDRVLVDMTPTDYVEHSNKKLETALVAVDDVTKNVFDFVLDLPYNEYEEIVGKIDEVMEGTEKK